MLLHVVKPPLPVHPDLDLTPRGQRCLREVIGLGPTTGHPQHRDVIDGTTVIRLAPTLGEKQGVFQNHLETAQHFFLAAVPVCLQLGGTARDHGGGELRGERSVRIILLRRDWSLHPPSLPMAPSSLGPSPTGPHLPCVAVALTQERHRSLLGQR